MKSALDTLRDRQSELQSMISDLQAILDEDLLKIRPNAKTAYELLCDLSKLVKDHLSEEDKGLFPSLLVHEDPKLKSIAWGFINGEKPLRKSFEDYHRKWLKDCDFNFTSEFLQESNDIFELVAKRIEQEQTILFPKLEKMGMFSENRAN